MTPFSRPVRELLIPPTILKNAFLSMVGSAIPQTAAVLFLPFLVRRLGPAQFGILSVAFVLIGYLSLFDFGTSRATTKLLSDTAALKDSIRTRQLLWTSITLQILIAVPAALTIALASRSIAKWLNVPANMEREGVMVIRLLALALPSLLLSLSLRSALEARRHFGAVTVIKTVCQPLLYLLPAVVLMLGFQLVAIVGALIVALAASATGYAIAVHRCYRIDRFARPTRGCFKDLVSYSGWAGGSSIIVPLLVYLDRLVIANVLGVAVLAYYVVPSELVARLQVVPVSLMTALFPEVSAASTSSPYQARKLYRSGIVLIVVLLSPVVLAALWWGPALLAWWFGAELPRASGRVLQILAVGVVLNAVSQVPGGYLDAIGRPDAKAKVLAACLVAYVPLLLALVLRAGLIGAALSWTARALVECVALHSALFRIRWREREEIHQPVLLGLGS